MNIEKTECFPLYDTLFQGIKNKNVTIKQKSEIVNCIKNMSNDKKELVYALILYHYIKKSNEELSNLNELPYGSNRNTLTWNISEIPNDLLHVIYGFCKLN